MYYPEDWVFDGLALIFMGVAVVNTHRCYVLFGAPTVPLCQIVFLRTRPQETEQRVQAPKTYVWMRALAIATCTYGLAPIFLTVRYWAPRSDRDLLNPLGHIAYHIAFTFFILPLLPWAGFNTYTTATIAGLTTQNWITRVIPTRVFPTIGVLFVFMRTIFLILLVELDEYRWVIAQLWVDAVYSLSLCFVITFVGWYCYRLCQKHVLAMEAEDHTGASGRNDTLTKVRGSARKLFWKSVRMSVFSVLALAYAVNTMIGEYGREGYDGLQSADEVIKELAAKTEFRVNELLLFALEFILYIFLQWEVWQLVKGLNFRLKKPEKESHTDTTALKASDTHELHLMEK